MLIIRYATSAEEALRLCSEGFEPVECSFGEDSVVGKYSLDHHGRYSKEPPVAVKAVRLALTGVRIQEFVSTGFPDTDAAYCIGVLAGHIPPHMKDAEAVAELDINPVCDQTIPRYRKALLHRKVSLRLPLSVEGFERSVAEAIRIFNGKYAEGEEEEAIEREKERQEGARNAIWRRSDNAALLTVFDDWGQDVWFPIAPIVVRFDEKNGVVTLYCDTDDPRNPFGLAGLKKVYKALGPGWGGREKVGGSPRGQRMSFKDAEEAYWIILFKKWGLRK